MTSTEHPLVFVGAATQDTIALVERFPAPDERVLAADLVRAGGGPAATAAVAAARLGHRVAFVGTVGADDEGAEILNGLTAEGIDVSGVDVERGARSAASLVIVDAAESTRAIVNRPPPEIRLSVRADELLAAAEWVHVDQAGWRPTHAWWAGRTERPRFSIDAGNPIPGFSPAGLDLYVPTIGALRRRYGRPERSELLAAALDEGAELVVATDGPHGSFALGVEQPLVSAPAHPGAVLSTLGAGDVFHGALLAAIQHGLPIETCLRYANLAAFRSCQGLDGRSAIPTHAEVVAALGAAST
ncbi:MAG: PfkB family carbohydrate kinase [Actinomycetota bacterium]